MNYKPAARSRERAILLAIKQKKRPIVLHFNLKIDRMRSSVYLSHTYNTPEVWGY